MCKRIQFHPIKPYSLVLAGLLLFRFTASAQQNDLRITNNASSSFPMVSYESICSFYSDRSDATVIQIAAEAFKKDVYDITGKEIGIINDRDAIKDYTIVAGTIGHSALLDELIAAKIITIPSFKNNWETFYITVVNRPYKKAKKLLVIAGNDRRGTAFGIFHLSRLMGVSPFVWWADVVPEKRNQLFVAGSYKGVSPSVQYRGIFINDEDWGLQPWAAKNLDTDIKDIGPKAYAKVFELLLRLKANYIWPAMHPSTKAFYYYKGNPKIADDYAIVVGSSHAEPMLRNNVFEWAVNFENEYGKKPGEWRYDTNKDVIHNYWNDRVKRATNYESVFTVGMRGVHDSGMPGPGDMNEKLKLLERIITDQREILQNNFKRPPDKTPQIFVPYKEVLSLYRQGLPLPDDITIIWPDDNHGFIRQLPDEKERKRRGGHGVYFHLSYWGSPHDYLWLSSISPSLIAYEMSKAYQYGASKLWVFNVGDIKPAELELQFALDMAYDVRHHQPADAINYSKQWATEIFGKDPATTIAAIKKEYYELAHAAKPEHLGMVLFSKKEMDNRMARYQSIATKATSLQGSIPERLKEAYFQLVLYPVLAAKLMNEKVFYTRQFEKLKAMNAFDSIKLLTEQYNSMLNGKWSGMMSWHPRDLKIFSAPENADSLKLLPDTLTLVKPHLVITAADFSTKKESASGKLIKIEGLGIIGKGLAFLQKGGTENQSTGNIADVYTSYPVKLEAGNYNILVKCLPTYPPEKDKQLRYGIALNAELPQLVNIHAETESTTWKKNVVNGFSYGKTMHTVAKDGNSVIKLYFRDTGLVINSIEIYKE